MHTPPTLRSFRRATALILAGSIAALLASHSAQAASGTWLNTGVTNGNWSTTSNWVSGIVPGLTSGTTNTDTATFQTAVGTFGTSGSPIVIDANRNISGITFTGAAGNYFIGSTGGNALRLTSGGTIQILNTLTATNAIENINAPLQIQFSNGTYTFANNSANGAGAGAGTLVFGGGITGGAAGATVLTLSGTNTNTNNITGAIGNGTATSVGLNKSGIGTWTLFGANTYTGATAVNAGKLFVASTGSLSGSSAVTVASTGTLTVAADTTAGRTFSNNLILTGGTVQGVLDNVGSGGTTTVGSLVTHTFTSSGTLAVPAALSGVSALVVGGGGGGGGGVSGIAYPAGGGGGKVTNSTTAVFSAGSNTVTVGSGGAGAFNANGVAGGSSSAGGITSAGGGAGVFTGKGGASGSGNAGGNRGNQAAGGGGGNSAAGANGVSNGTGGAGGAGSANTAISGLTGTYGGGGGGQSNSVQGAGGAGGGGSGGLTSVDGHNGVDGTSNTGGGGGGSAAGGSGLVVVQYAYGAAGGGNVTLGGTIDLQSASTLDAYGSGGLLNLQGAISTSTGSGGLTIASSNSSGGVVRFGTANSYLGTTGINAGATLEITANDALGNTSSGTSVTSGGALKLTGVNYSTAEPLSIRGTGVSNGGALVNSGTSTYAGQITAATNASINAGGGSLSLTGGLVKNGTTLTLTGGGTINVSGVGISGASANSDLVVDGTTVNLNVANTYNGPTFIRNSGTLNANVANALPTANGRTAVTFDGTGTSALALGADQAVASLTSTGAATVNLNAQTLTLGDASGSTSFAGSIGGTGGALIKDGGSTQTLTGANGYSGDTTVNQGTLALGNVNAIANSTLDTGASGAQAVTFTVAGPNTYNVGGLKGTDDLAIGANTLSVGANGQNTSYAGALSGSTGNLTKTGVGALTLSGSSANTHTGLTTVNGGTLIAGKTSALAIPADVTLGDGATTPGLDTLQLSGTGGNQIANTAILTLNGTTTNAGTFRLNARSETIGGLVSTVGAGVVENGTAGSSLLTLDVNTIDRSFAGILRDGAAGTLALTKSGTAKQTLTGANTYTGNTAVSQGRLALSGGGSFANSPDIAVASGAFLDVSAVTSGANWDGTRFAVVNGQTLHGTGTVLGAMDVSAGGTIAPGNSIGTLAVAGLSLTSATSHFALEIDLGLTPAADLLNVTGGIALNGSALDLSLFNLSPMGLPMTFLFAANDLADVVSGTFGTINGVPMGYTATVDYAFLGTDALGRIGDGNDLAVVIDLEAIPEPGTAVWGLAMSLLACGRRRRTPVGISPAPRC